MDMFAEESCFSDVFVFFSREKKTLVISTEISKMSQQLGTIPVMFPDTAWHDYKPFIS